MMADWEIASVSVVIPCYRCSEVIERAVASVASQTLVPAEVFLVDDCSGDDTLAFLYDLQNRYPAGWIHVIEQPENRGPGEARNAGWNRATHPYIAFLDADDSWHPQKVEIQYRWMIKHPDVALTGHATWQIRDEDDPIRFLKMAAVNSGFRKVTYNRLLWSNCFPTRSVMLRRDLPIRFLPGKYHSEDYLLWLQAACAGAAMARSEHTMAFLYKRHYGESGLSGQMWQMEKGELDTYFRVFKERCFGPGMFALLFVRSLALFCKRLIVSFT